MEDSGDGPRSPGVAASSGTPAMLRPSLVPGRANGDPVRCGPQLGEPVRCETGVCRGEEGM